MPSPEVFEAVLERRTAGTDGDPVAAGICIDMRGRIVRQEIRRAARGLDVRIA